MLWPGSVGTQVLSPMASFLSVPQPLLASHFSYPPSPNPRVFRLISRSDDGQYLSQEPTTFAPMHSPFLTRMQNACDQNHDQAIQVVAIADRDEVP